MAEYVPYRGRCVRRMANVISCQITLLTMGYLNNDLRFSRRAVFVISTAERRLRRASPERRQFIRACAGNVGRGPGCEGAGREVVSEPRGVRSRRPDRRPDPVASLRPEELDTSDGGVSWCGSTHQFQCRDPREVIAGEGAGDSGAGRRYLLTSIRL